MFSSISKAWNEVSDESGGDKESSVKFSQSTRDSPRRNGHYIHYDKSKNPLDRIRKTEGKKGSPRILKPSNDNKQNSVWGSALKNLSKVFKKDDGELGSMKEYMNGMIKVPKERKELVRSKRGDTLSIGDLDKDNVNERESRRRRRTDTISSRVESIGNSFNRYKKRRNGDPTEVPKYGSYSKFEIDVPKYQYQKETNNGYENYSTAVDTRYHSNETSWKAHTPTDSKPASQGLTFSKITAHDLPSSPIYHNTQSSLSKEHSKKSNLSLENNVDKSYIDSSRIEQLCKKVEQLENTVEGLRDELRQANEKSLQLEKSINSNDHSILKDLDKTDDMPHFKFEDDNNISRPLSPVKVDLDRFKFIR